ncbi:MAG: HNH endonuclease [Rhodospirillaceae bacterium]|nr:HNH endonuclease [Rhodospirillaceae bacterium]
MAKSVFTHRVGSQYDDLPEQRYHFPGRYLRQVQRSVGDLIVYYEPRRDKGRQAYIATAQVNSIEQDPKTPDHYYANLSGYLDFPTPVPFRIEETTFERSLQNPDRSTNLGQFQWAVRPIPEEEFAAIAAIGLSDADEESSLTQGLREPAPEPMERPLVQQLVSRRIRDKAFRQVVRRAYDDRCALTGIRMINGGGRSEVDAAHIRPVGDGHNGPDALRNGLALSKTVHWMFDRCFVTLDENYKILVKESLVPDEVKRLFVPGLTALLPNDPAFRPHPEYVAYHRKMFLEKKHG